MQPIPLSHYDVHEPTPMNVVATTWVFKTDSFNHDVSTESFSETVHM